MADETERVFLIADLAGYTALTEAHGSLEAARVVRRYAELTMAVLEPGLELVEQLGDQVLIVGADPGRALLTAVRLREVVEAEPLFPTIRAGLDAGPCHVEGRRYFAAALNVAARVAAYARPGQVLCTERVARSARDVPGLALQALGAVRFKNVPVPVPVVAVRGNGGTEQSDAVDPVCQMRVSPETAPARLPYGGQTYPFCSFECAKRFAESPEAYIGA
jgi:class 3 adenylate cyclase/YHS domain-containing protein